MKILQLCNKPPYPAVDGGTLGMHRYTEGFLKAGHQVKVLSIWTDKHPVLDSMDEEYRQKVGFEAVYVDLTPKAVNAGVALLCGDSYNVKRYESRAFEQKLVEVLEQDNYDAVQVESVFLTPYVPAIRNHSNAKVVLRAPNVENQIWRQNALNERNWGKRWYLKKLALALRMYEVEHINDYDGVVCVSPLDRKFFIENGCRRQVIVAPFAVTNPRIADYSQSDPNLLFHIGSMDWEPNLESIQWLIDKIWPKIHAAVPSARLMLAGNKMPDHLLNLKMVGVTVMGRVPDALEFMRQGQINIVPLKSGSGIRVKIIEAMSLGKTVITTTTGANGIEYTDGKELLIADTEEAFVEQVRRCIAHPDEAKTIGANAFQLVKEKYDNDIVMAHLIAFYEKMQ